LKYRFRARVALQNTLQSLSKFGWIETKYLKTIIFFL
jgi:hypothetical protein